MSLKLVTKPLAASLKERIEAKKSESTGHRIAPPSAVNVEPDRNFVDKASAEGEPVAMKRKEGKRYTPEYKAKVVARVLKAKDTGNETITAIAIDEKLNETAIYNWLKQAKSEANGKAKTKSKERVLSNDKPKDSERMPLKITGLTPLIRELVIGELKKELAPIVRDELDRRLRGK